MGSSRESYSIWKYIQKGNWSKVWSLISTLLVFWKKSWNRKYIIIDSVVIPFNKHIGCKVFGHKWSLGDNVDLGDMTVCWKCFKWETKQQRKINNREEKIDQLLK